METINASILNGLTDEDLKNVLVYNLGTEQSQKGKLWLGDDWCNLTNADDKIFGFYNDTIAKIVITNNDVTIFVCHWYEVPF